MAPWLIWVICGIVMVLLELILPGGVIIFLGTAAVIVGTLLYFEWITSVSTSFISWFIVSITLLLFLRERLSRYFGGSFKVQNTDEDLDLIGSQVIVVEDIFPYKKGRVKFRETTWVARSNERVKAGEKALVSKRDGNELVVKNFF